MKNTKNSLTHLCLKKVPSVNISKPKEEFFIPIVADRFIKEKAGIIKVINTSAQWFGVTYKEDAPSVQDKLLKLVEDGEYPENIWLK